MKAARTDACVVCGIDDLRAAEGAAKVALRLARDLGSQALLVHVIDEAYALPFGLRAPDFGKARRMRRKLLAIAEQHQCPIPAKVRIDRGDPLTTLLAVAEEEDAALIVVAARRIGRGAATPIGGVTSGLMRAAPCPVVVVPLRAPAPLDLPRMCDVVCGVQGDGSQTDLRVLKLASDLSSRLRGQLHAVHGYRPGASPADTPGPQRRLNDTLERAGVEAQGNFLPLPAAEALERVAEERSARLIVVGPERRGGDLLGSVIIRLAAEGSTPLVVVPDDAKLDAGSGHYELTA